MSELRAVRLADGRVLRVRAVQHGDEVALGRLYRSLSADDRHRRFFTAAYRPSKEALHNWVETESRGGYRLVAELDGEIVGDAGYYRLEGGDDAEFDITIDHDFRGWLGPYLLDALIEAAAARGIQDLQADILRENRTMLALVAARGYVTVANDDHNVIRVRIGVRDSVPHWPTVRSGDRVIVESPGGEWHAADTARSNGLEVAVCPGPRSADHHCPVLRGEPCPLVDQADVVVFALPVDDPDARRILAAHPELHPGTVLCVEAHGEPSPTVVPLPRGAVPLEADDPTETDSVIRALGREPHLPRRTPPHA